MTNVTNTTAVLNLVTDKCILASRQDGAVTQKFNMGLKVGGLFTLLAISSLACMAPLFGTKFPVIKLPNRVMFAARHFGTGVLIATAFCHLIPTAFIALHNPCLPDFWLTKYQAMPGAIGMGAIFFVITVEMLLCRRMHAHTEEIDSESAEPTDSDPIISSPKKDVMQCMLLEMGILFHSVFIGMSLSVIANEEFIVLLVAICFHQTFEGLALGSRIATINFPHNQRFKPWLMCLAYGTTTPIGQAIGIITQSFYDQNSTTGLLMVGIMNAISSGLLVYASLVELFAEDFMSEKAEKELAGKKMWVAFACVFAGAFAMAFVGAFA